MKRIVYLLIVVFCSSSITAQHSNSAERQKRWEEMKVKRAAFFTERIGMTSEEAQQFWPIYNELQDKKGALNEKIHKIHHNAQKDEKGERILDYEKLNDETISIKVQEANLDKIYYQKFKTVLSAEKIYRFYRAERDWAGELLKQIKKL
jgi:hypothetical protein